MSNGPEFFQTVMGQRFFTSDVPRITDALEKIADKLDADNKNKPVFSDDQLDETWERMLNRKTENKSAWTGIIKSIARYIEKSPKTDFRFEISDIDTILCESNADADCIAEFLEQCGIAEIVHTRKTDDLTYEWEVYTD